jgi:mono/diheme cytochrome c family protein
MRSRVALLVVVGLLFAGVAYLVRMIDRGFSAREPPSAVEAAVARFMRSMAMPSDARTKPNPLRPDASVLSEARAHFADHCAGCHANNGSGQTTMGQNLYPKAPDMRGPATQNKTDGELFYIIHNGIRLTGMPAWGEAGAGEDLDSWKLALLIHHLPVLTPEEELGMQRLNPRGAAAWEEEKAEEEFLRGGSAPSNQPEAR